MLTVRKRHKAFGRGTLRFLYPRQPQGPRLSARVRGRDDPLRLQPRRARSQAVELDLSSFAGRIPVELTGRLAFPPIGQLTYLLTLPPFAFYWFTPVDRRQPAGLASAGARADGRIQTLVLRARHRRCRWTPTERRFWSTTCCPPICAPPLVRVEGRDRSSRCASRAARPVPTRQLELLLDRARGHAVAPSRALSAAAGDRLGGAQPTPCRSSLRWRGCGAGRRVGFLTDAFAIDALPLRGVARCCAVSAVRQLADRRNPLPADEPGWPQVEFSPQPEIRRLSAEQSNSSLIVGDEAMLKLIRRVFAGHPSGGGNDAAT